MVTTGAYPDLVIYPDRLTDNYSPPPDMDMAVDSVPTSDPTEMIMGWTLGEVDERPTKRLAKKIPPLSPVKRVKQDTAPSATQQSTPKIKTFRPLHRKALDLTRQPFKSPLIHPPNRPASGTAAQVSSPNSMLSSTAIAKIRTLTSELSQLKQAVRLGQPASDKGPESADDLLRQTIEKWRSGAREAAEALYAFGQKAGWTGPVKQSTSFSYFDDKPAHHRASRPRPERPSWGYDDDEDDGQDDSQSGTESILEISQRALSQDIPSLSHANRVPKRYGKLFQVDDDPSEGDGGGDGSQPMHAEANEFQDSTSSDGREDETAFTMVSMLTMFGIRPDLLGWSQEDEDWVT